MTTKDYCAIARVLVLTRPAGNDYESISYGIWHSFRTALADMLQTSNANFDRQHFLAACEEVLL